MGPIERGINTTFIVLALLVAVANLIVAATAATQPWINIFIAVILVVQSYGLGKDARSK
ncbi:membrane protein [Microbacterium phage Cece]|nr:membrane protein [Microbacterium phage Cece]UVG35316.1 membrane protein [Microbacterium phage Cece]